MGFGNPAKPPVHQFIALFEFSPSTRSYRMKRTAVLSLATSLIVLLSSTGFLQAQSVSGTAPTTAVSPTASLQATEPAQAIYADVTSTAYPVTISKWSAAVQFLSFDEVDQERQNSITDDTAVLRHLIGKSSSGPSTRNALGVTVWQRAEGANGAIYVDGVGLFLILDADRPVAPIGEEAAIEKRDASEVSEWERAKKEIQREPGTMVIDAVVQYRQAAGVYAAFPGAQQAYAAEFVEELDASVSNALGQAGNFRALAPSDSVTVIAYGPAAEANQRTVFAWRVRMSDAQPDKSIPQSKIERRQGVEKFVKTSPWFSGGMAR
jgi:hypothetical protein